MLMPVPTTALVDNELVTLVSKDAVRISPRYKNGWLILVSAPNEEWLHYELSRIAPDKSDILRRRVSESEITVLDKYVIRRMLVVSTEAKQLAGDWFNRQFDPRKQIFDWDFLDLATWNPDDNNVYSEVVFLINRDKLSNTDLVVRFLPEDVQPWLRSESSRREMIVGKKTVSDAAGQPRTVSAIVAPSSRHLNEALNSTVVETIPEFVRKESFSDLSGFTEVLVVAKSGDESLGKLLNDLGGKMASALADGTGFTCSSRQDLKDIIYERIRIAQDGRVDDKTVADILSKMPGATALAVAHLEAVDATTRFSSPGPVCLTEAYSEFRDPEPSKPSKPNPHERKYGIAGPRIYPQGENDPRYIERYNKWRYELMPQYERALGRWERARDDYEDRRRRHQMTWRRSIAASEIVSASGNLIIYDLRKSSSDRGEVAFSCPISGAAQRTEDYYTDTIVVQGEQAQPPGLPIPPALDYVSDATLVSEALQRACASAMRELARKAVLPADVTRSPIASANVDADPNAEPRKVKQYVKVEVVGSVKAAVKPTGQGLVVARSAALDDAIPKLLESIGMACPGSSVTEDEVRSKLAVVSEGWDKTGGQYRVRCVFEGDVFVADAPE
jgi:hypothetical protein